MLILLQALSLYGAVSAISPILQQFQDNGIAFEEYGEGRVIAGENHCRPWTLDLFEYVNDLNTKDMSDYGRDMLKKKLFDSFNSICKGFDIPTDSLVNRQAFNFSEYRSAHFMDRFELTWNAMKFERDLKTFFLEHKFGTPFLKLVNEHLLRLSGAADPMEFSHRTTVFPNMCNVGQLKLDAKLCFNISEPQKAGTVFAISHAGQFVNDEKAFVYYDIPEFVLIEDTNNSISVIDMKKCKIMFGTFIYCFDEVESTCQLPSLSGCQLYARRVTEDSFEFARDFGTGRIVATNQASYDVFHNGTLITAPSLQFTVNFNFTTDLNDNVVVDALKMTPVLPQKRSFPSLDDMSLKSLTAEPTTVFETTRKGTKYLSHNVKTQDFWTGLGSLFGFF